MTDDADMRPVLPVMGRDSNIACLVFGHWLANHRPMIRQPMVLQMIRNFHARANWIVAGATLALGACASGDTCEEPEFYEFAESGKRIVAPDDLTDIAAYKELTIPEASPQPGRAPQEGCLDRPPTMRTSADREESETP